MKARTTSRRAKVPETFEELNALHPLRPINDKVDFESIANWLFRNYLQARSHGASPQEARESVAKQIRESDEWRQKQQ